MDTFLQGSIVLHSKIREHESILVSDSDSDIPPRDQPSGYVARTVQPRLHSKEASTLVWNDIWKKQERINKTSFSFFSMISAILWDSTKGYIPTKTPQNHWENLKKCFLRTLLNQDQRLGYCFFNAAGVPSRDPRNFFSSFGTSSTITLMTSQESSSIPSHLVRTCYSFPSCRRSIRLSTSNFASSC